MTRTIVAILALSPAMLFAQTTPAQPASTPVLRSSLTQPAAFAELKSADPKVAPTPLRTSTGVVAPVMLLQDKAAEDQDLHSSTLHLSRTVVLNFTVDATGKANHITVEKSADNYTDAAAIAKVSSSHFRPGTLDGQPTAVPIRLTLVVQRSIN